jgi:hypothetical protein
LVFVQWTFFAIFRSSKSRANGLYSYICTRLVGERGGIYAGYKTSILSSNARRVFPELTGPQNTQKRWRRCCAGEGLPGLTSYPEFYIWVCPVIFWKLFFLNKKSPYKPYKSPYKPIQIVIEHKVDDNIKIILPSVCDLLDSHHIKSELPKLLIC